ncbi:hypothetical protein BJ508DRAFT_336542 [Ascobolus immersus RN42]|uniref:Uncharacterized protein n=1 Tax=Ascobolus immersus RN42 TaxID=1160509 RepID=A0A3N4HMU4_ASCIM|nr:hypothetical protein BJ508DRAFT_336542 [Ascobolus immersus RN42]
MTKTPGGVVGKGDDNAVEGYGEGKTILSGRVGNRGDDNAREEREGVESKTPSREGGGRSQKTGGGKDDEEMVPAKKTKKQTIFILIKGSLAAEIKYRARPYTETYDIKRLGYLLTQIRYRDHPNETVVQYNEWLREKRQRLVTRLGVQLDSYAMRAVLYLEAMHAYYPAEVNKILDSLQTGATPKPSGGEDFRSLSLDHVISQMETLTSMSSGPASLKALKISVTGSSQHGGGSGRKERAKVARGERDTRMENSNYQPCMRILALGLSPSLNHHNSALYADGPTTQ